MEIDIYVKTVDFTAITQQNTAPFVRSVSEDMIITAAFLENVLEKETSQFSASS